MRAKASAAVFIVSIKGLPGWTVRGVEATGS